MLRLLWQFLWYLRWPSAVCAFTFFVLAILLQPRPVSEYTISAKRPEQRVDYDRFIISPSGRFAFLSDQSTKQTALVELASGRTIFDRSIKDLSECRFDDEDALVFTDYGDHDKTIECWRWLPGTNAPTKICERPAFLPGIHFGESQHSSWYPGSIARLENGIALNSFLSPDTRTWLIPVRDQKSFHFELLDACTGQSKSKLDPPQNQPDLGEKPVCEVAFSTDSKLILLQYPLPNEFKDHETLSYELEVHSAETGKRIRHQALPYKTKLEQLVHFDDKHILAFEAENKLHYLQHLSSEQGYQRIMMKETVPEPIEHSRDPKHIEEAVEISAELGPIMGTTDGMMMYCWQLQRWPKGVGAGHLAYAPGYYFACRHISTGQLIHSERLPLRKRSGQDLFEEGWELLGILPKHGLLFKEPTNTSLEETMLGISQPQWKQTLESWRGKYASWLPSLLKEDTQLVYLDAVTGKTIDRLSLSFGRNLIAFHVPKQQSLYLGESIHDGLEIAGFHFLQFRYPFCKPWLLILAWSLGLFNALAGLQLLFLLIKRMLRKIQPV